MQDARSPIEQLKLNEYDVTVVVTGGGIHAQAGAVRLGLSRAIIAKDTGLEAAPSHDGFPHPRFPHGGAQEVRPQQGPPGSAVGEALKKNPAHVCGIFL